MAIAARVSDVAFAALTVESTIQDLHPGIKANRQNNAMTLLYAEYGHAVPLEMVQGFRNCVFAGITPPPRLLVAIAECFATYLESEGRKTLDRAFNLQSTPALGHPINAQKIRGKRGQHLFLMWQLRQQAKGKKLSIEHAADKIISRLKLPISRDALARDYSRLKMDKIFSHFPKADSE